MKIVANYHTHTYRCGHAFGNEEEYIQCAIEGGIKILGFSDHVMLPHHQQRGVRGDYSELEGYISSLRNLKEKYKDKIKILIGLECEYFPQYVEYYKSLLNDYHLDYLIQGQHCYINNEERFAWYDADIHSLVDDIINGMKLGIFKYLAHPDMWVERFNKWNEDLEKEAHRICEAAVKYNVPLEINLGHFIPDGHISNHLEYPYEPFWEIASHYPIKVFIGRDAHDPRALLEENQNFFHALYIVNKYHLTLLNEVEE